MSASAMAAEIAIYAGEHYVTVADDGYSVVVKTPWFGREIFSRLADSVAFWRPDSWTCSADNTLKFLFHRSTSDAQD